MRSWAVVRCMVLVSLPLEVFKFFISVSEYISEGWIQGTHTWISVNKRWEAAVQMEGFVFTQTPEGEWYGKKTLGFGQLACGRKAILGCCQMCKNVTQKIWLYCLLYCFPFFFPLRGLGRTWCCSGATPNSTQGSLLVTQGTLYSAGDLTQGPGSASCKASTSLSILFLWPQDRFF